MKTKTFYKSLPAAYYRAQGYKNKEAGVEAAYEKAERRYALKQLPGDPLALCNVESRLEKLRRLRGPSVGEIEAALFDNYRTSESRWAGGENYLTVKFTSVSDVFAAGNSHRAWSRNGKWSGTNASFQLGISWRHDLTLVVDGLLNLYSRHVQGNLYEAVWVKQGRGFSLEAVEGFIAKHGSISYHAATAEAAKAGLMRKRRAAKKAALSKVAFKAVADQLVISKADALQAGMCESGIASFCNRHELDDSQSYKASEILALAEESDHYDAVVTIIQTAAASKAS